MNRIARISALFYVLVIITGSIALAIGGKYVVTGDPAATATNILTHEESFRLSWAINLLANSCYVVVVALFYVLFRSVNRSLSFTAALFGFMGCAVSSVASAIKLSPLVILKSDVLSKQQLQALAYLFIKLNANIGSMALTFFGVYCFLIGMLILTSAIVPRFVGVLMTIAGLGWLTFAWAPLANALAPFNMIPGIIGEGVLTLWLLWKGVDEGNRLSQVRLA